MPVPEFSQYVEYVTEGPIVHPVDPAQAALDNPLTLQALQAGYAHVTALGRAPVMDSAALDALKTAAAEHYAADVVDNEIVSSDPAQVVDRLLWVRDRPEWGAGIDAHLGMVVFWQGTLFRCVQSHRTKIDWTPDATPALWTRYYEPDEVPAWVQPTGAQDAWADGARVTHAGQTWRSLIPDNTTEPGSDPRWWECEDCETTTEWAVGVAYKGDNTEGAGNGDIVTYQGAEYRCLQSHTSQAGWTPSAVPALWEAL